MAAGLADMCATMSRGKKAYAQYEDVLTEASARLALLREELKSAIDADAASYNEVMKAYKLPKDSAKRAAAIVAGLKLATGVPLGVAESVAEVQQISAKLKPITSPGMISDLTAGMAMAKAALESALANVEINLDSIKAETVEDEAFVGQTRRRAAELGAGV
jgi:formiminotetrahydrofolate cyclodeaminase